MNLNIHTRREFSGRLATLISAVGIAGTAFAATGGGDATRGGIPHPARNDGREEDGRGGGVQGKGQNENCLETGGTIHQEVVFKASQKRVYEALTDAGQFTKV